MIESALSAVLVVNTSHAPAAFFYKLVMPTTEIDGREYSNHWGVNQYTVEPGVHTVAVSYPWVLRKCGRATVSFQIRAGERKTVRYYAPMIRLWPGSISIE